MEIEWYSRSVRRNKLTRQRSFASLKGTRSMGIARDDELYAMREGRNFSDLSISVLKSIAWIICDKSGINTGMDNGGQVRRVS